MSGVSISLRATKVANVLLKQKEATIQAGLHAVHSTAESVFNDSQMNMHKVTGALASSGKITYADTDTSAIAYIGYGDSSINPQSGETTASYAVEAHEAFNGKWLENAMVSNQDLFRQNLVSGISKALST